MQDPRALKNPRNLGSWRAWQGEAYRRSGFLAIAGGVSPLLTIVFVVACTLFKPALRDVVTIEVGFGLYLAAVLGLTGFAVLRLNAWKRANPWTPPS
jgi:hypothetical protein